MHRPFIRLLLLLSAAIPLASFAAESMLMIEDFYVRLSPPSAPATGAFMVIKNAGAADRQLIKAECLDAKTAELHNHINENGLMKMRQVHSIEIKAHGKTELKPGSYHVMLIGMKRPLKDGDVVPITLSFDDGSKLLVDVPVRKLQTDMPVEKAMHHGAMAH